VSLGPVVTGSRLRVDKRRRSEHLSVGISPDLVQHSWLEIELNRAGNIGSGIGLLEEYCFCVIEKDKSARSAHI
jgi:hypothetical protein